LQAARDARPRCSPVGDGALGFWKALRDVFAHTNEQGCWWHYADLRIMPTSHVWRTQLTLKKSA
jgi:hypothetical protein